MFSLKLHFESLKPALHQRKQKHFFSSAYLPLFRWQLSESTNAKREDAFKSPANGRSESGMNSSVGIQYSRLTFATLSGTLLCGHG